MVLESLGTPNPRQKEFLDIVRKQSHRRIFYGGARGPGKSWAMRRAMVERRVNHPGSRGLILRRTYEEAWGNHIWKLLQELPKDSYVYNGSQHAFLFDNGSRLEIGYCKTDKDVLRYQGQEYDDLAIDEITQFQEVWFDALTASVRSTRGDLVPLMMVAGNPGGIGHAWVKRRWIDRDYQGKEKPEDYVAILGHVYDNTVLMETDPDYLATLESLPDDLRRAWLEGDWDVFAGQFFHELRRDIHGFTGDIPEGWTFRCLDYGESAPSAVYWCRVDYDGHIWVYRELYGKGMRYTALADKIKEMTDEEIRYTVGSPDIFAKSKGTGEVGAETLTRRGVPVVRADDNRIEGWRHMREFVIPEAPRLHVHTDNCRNWWRTVPTQIYDEHRTEDMDPDGEDHAAEATRYGLMSRPRPADAPREPKLPYSCALSVLARARRRRRRR